MAHGVENRPQGIKLREKMTTKERSGHGVRSTVGDIPQAVLHPPKHKQLRRVQPIVHTPNEKRKPQYVKRVWE